jgi:hypothetical protein
LVNPVQGNNEQVLKVCEDGILIQLLTFWTLFLLLKKQRFGE